MVGSVLISRSQPVLNVFSGKEMCCKVYKKQNKMGRLANFILVFSLIVTGTLKSQSANWNIEPVATLWVTGAWDGFECNGDYIFCSNSWGIMVYRFIQGEDEEPVLIGRYPTPGASKGLFLRDTLLYICDWPNHLRIWSVADVNNIYEIGYCEEEITEYNTIQVQGDYAYIIPAWLAHTRIGLRIVSVEDPANPQIMGFVEYHNQDLVDLRVSGDFAYLVGPGPWPVRGGVHVVNVEDPENPFEDEYYGYDESHGSWGIELFEDTLLVRTNDSFYVISVSDPENLNVITTNNAEYITGKLVYRQRYLFCLGRGVRIVDFVDIFNPRLLGQVNFDYLGSFASYDPEISGDYAFMGAGVYGWKAINVSNYRNPVIEYDSPDSEWGSFKGIAKHGDYLFVTDALDVHIVGEDRYPVNRFRVFSVENLDDPMEVATLRSIGQYAKQIEVVGDRAYVGGKACVLTIFDISDPENPSQLGRGPFSGLEDFMIQGEYAYIADNEIFVFSIADPGDIRIIGRYEPYDTEDGRNTGSYHNLGISANTLVISGRIPGQHYHLWTYDISDPESLDSLGRCQLPTSSASTGLVTLGEYAYIGDARGLYVISIADPHHPEPIWSDQSTGVGGLNIFDGRLYLGSSEGMRIYSLDDPERPEQVGIYDVPSGSCDIFVENNLAYLSGGHDISVYDVSRALGAWYIGLSEEHHDFGAVTIDSSAEWELVITNRSRVRREITGVRVESANLRDPFECQFDRSFNLQSGADTSLIVTFSPDTTVDYGGTVFIISDELEMWVSLSGAGGAPEAVNVSPELPSRFALHSPYPNPFNLVTQIRYEIPKAVDVKLVIFDVVGREVIRLVDEQQGAGYHSVSWKGTNSNGLLITSGLYFVRLESGPFVRIHKIALIK